MISKYWNQNDIGSLPDYFPARWKVVWAWDYYHIWFTNWPSIAHSWIPCTPLLAAMVCEEFPEGFSKRVCDKRSLPKCVLATGAPWVQLYYSFSHIHRDVRHSGSIIGTRMLWNKNRVHVSWENILFLWWCIGEYCHALHYHRIELSLSEAGGDQLGAAIAHRKIGECECELGNYSSALDHQTQHLKIARQLGEFSYCRQSGG